MAFHLLLLFSVREWESSTSEELYKRYVAEKEEKKVFSE